MKLDDARLEALAQLAFAELGGERLRAELCPCCGAKRENFRDSRSEREAKISGLCQACQDVVFA